MRAIREKGRTEKKSASRCCSTRRLLLVCGIFMVGIFVIRNFSGVSVSDYLPVDEWDEFVRSETWANLETLVSSPSKDIPAATVDVPSKITIAYAVSITGCPTDKRTSLVDGAAVVHQSIRLASRHSKYGYKMLAFVHPDAQDCAEFLSNLGYEILIRDTPFNETQIQNPDLVKAQGNSCCGTKEYLKLYSYVQFDYPVVVHLDLDCLVLKPMDDVFDLMLDPSFDRTRIPSMWLKPEEMPEKVDFVFTRDYGMVQPGVRKPHQIGVQGGFLVVRPNQTDFDRNVEIILAGGNFESSRGWGGRVKAYGGYYGAGTIQGLASYYYGEFARNRSVELNRCYYDSMVDKPYGDGTKNTSCRTLEDECQDCRETDVKDIYTAHFTNCGKPFWCPNPASWWHKQEESEKQYRLCMDLFHEWHLVRSSLENEWARKYPNYHPVYTHAAYDTSTTRGFYLNFSLGHCGSRKRYEPIQFPQLNSGEISLLPQENIYEETVPADRRQDGSLIDMAQNATLQEKTMTETVSPEGKSLGAVIATSRTHTETTIPAFEPRSRVNKTKIAYAVSITKCELSSNWNLLDSGAVLHQSIRLASANSSYGYQMLAFVHPDATECAPHLAKLGYDVQVRDTPFNESAIQSADLIRAQENSCCGAKEYLKLYSYIQHEYPIVVHLDLDTLVIKPMDDIFSLMLDKTFDRSRIDSMWLKPEEFPEQVDFLFTRDYNMVDPPRRQPHQIGVQGGFLVVRPNETDFHKYVDIILSGGDYNIHEGWGGPKLAYGGYYGAGTIQGLASYYYGHFAKNRSLELNRCYYDVMADDPMGKDVHVEEDVRRCRTLEDTCQDCRTVDPKEIFTAHFTVCGKPYGCHDHPEPLCRKLHHEWHRVRWTLEKEWMDKFEGYMPARVNSSKDDFTEGHCKQEQRFRSYIPLKFPAEMSDTDVM